MRRLTPGTGKWGDNVEDFLQLFNVRDILLHIVNTLILFVAIRLLVYKPVRKFMNARTERVQAQMDEAAAREAEAKQALEDANAQREEAARLAVMAQAESAEQRGPARPKRSRRPGGRRKTSSPRRRPRPTRSAGRRRRTFRRRRCRWRWKSPKK